MVELLVIARGLGKPSLQVRVIRVNAKRRAQIARRMAAAGIPAWRIRSVARLSVAGLARALAARPADSIWGSFADQVRAEMQAAA